MKLKRRFNERITAISVRSKNKVVIIAARLYTGAVAKVEQPGKFERVTYVDRYELG